MLGQLPLARGDAPVEASSVKTPLEGAMRSPKLLKPESVTALLAGQHRALAEASADDAVAAPGPVPASASLPTDGNDATLLTSVTVESRETHWNFTDPTQQAAAQVASRVMHDQSPAKGNPLAQLSATRETKPASTSVAAPAAQPQSTTTSPPAPVAQGDPQQQSFSETHDGSSGAHEQSPSNTGERKILEGATSSRATERTTSTDTSVAPGAPPSPAAQVKNSIVDALADGNSEGKTVSTSPLLSDRPQVSSQPLRTLELTLAPPDLGSVKLRLSLKANTLSIEAEASKATTARMLNDDRDGLTQNLRDAGYDVSSLKITDAAQTSSAGSNNSQTGGSPFQDGGQARASFSERRDGDMQRRDGAPQGQTQQRQKNSDSETTRAADAPAARQSNAIYI